MSNNKLAVLGDIERRLAAVRTVDEAKSIRDKAEAIRIYAKSARKGLEVQNQVAFVKIQAERRGGSLSAQMEEARRGGARDRGNGNVSKLKTLQAAGISPVTAHRWEKMAAVPETKVRELAARATDEGFELTSASVYALGNGKPHVSYNSGENEWYTPREYIAAARETMGGIDLDPASTKEANTVVGAETFYTAEQDGLSRPWRGRVWLNPPYATDLIGRFADKLAGEYAAERTIAACVLVNNATETGWFETIAQHATAVCFPRGRVKFWAPKKSSATPLQGQAVLYLGKAANRFATSFQAIGRVWHQ